MTWPSGSDQSNKNEGAPDSLASWDAQLNSPPRSLLTTTLRFDLLRGNGRDGLL